MVAVELNGVASGTVPLRARRPLEPRAPGAGLLMVRPTGARIGLRLAADSCLVFAAPAPGAQRDEAGLPGDAMVTDPAVPALQDTDPAYPGLRREIQRHP